MKKIACLFMVLAFALRLPAASGPATLTGEIKDYKGGAVECMIKTDSAFLPDSMTVSAQGAFTYTRDASQGMEVWVASEDAKGYVRIYLKNGGKQHVVLAASADSINWRCNITLSGDSKASEYLLAFDREFGPTAKWTVKDAGGYDTFKSYKSAIDSAATTLAGQLNSVGDETFLVKEGKILKDKQVLLTFNYMQAKRAAGQPTGTDKELLEFVSGLDYNTMESAKNRLVDRYIDWYMSCHADSVSGPGVQFFSVLKQCVSNREVIDYVADGYMASYIEGGADAYLLPTYEAYRQTTSHQDLVEKYKSVCDNLKKLLPGSAAPDFALNDVTDKVLKFSDVVGKGKVVYLDVWATWCGPCCAEIPHMEKLVKHYAGNDKIEIVSISLDNKVDRWKKKLEADKPEWRQFITPEGLKSTLCQEYQIDGIPRFMLFDKEGKIIDINAPRPSNESIIDYLDAQLQ